MANLDRSTHEIHVACAVGPVNQPTPTFRTLRDIPDLHLRPVHFGCERPDRTLRGSLVWLLGAVRAVVALFPLASYVRRRGISVIHTSDRPRDAMACVLLARLTRAKCIVHVHVAFGDWMNPLLKWALRRADALIAVSAFVAKTLSDAGYGRDRTYVVLNGIDPRQWEPGVGSDEIRQEFGADDDTFLVLTVCRLFAEKGPGALISSLATISPDLPDTRLLIVGQEMTRGYAAELKALAASHGLDGKVVLTGRRDDVARLMAAADVYAMPSLDEPFGLVYLEAMAMELPVVALDSGGAPEVIESGVTGLLSDPGDAVALAANLCTLAFDRQKRKEMGIRGRQHVFENFTVGRMARDVASVYRKVAPPARTRTEGTCDWHDVAVDR
jgi:glycosyltransferase involved in cell wall biosynthesis